MRCDSNQPNNAVHSFVQNAMQFNAIQLTCTTHDATATVWRFGFIRSGGFSTKNWLYGASQFMGNARSIVCVSSCFSRTLIDFSLHSENKRIHLLHKTMLFLLLSTKKKIIPKSQIKPNVISPLERLDLVFNVEIEFNISYCLEFFFVPLSFTSSMGRF